MTNESQYHDEKQTFDTDGYVIVRGLFTSDETD